MWVSYFVSDAVDVPVYLSNANVLFCFVFIIFPHRLPISLDIWAAQDLKGYSRLLPVRSFDFQATLDSALP